MNPYKFIKDYEAMYDECMQGAEEMAKEDPEFAKLWDGKFGVLEPLMNQIRNNPYTLEGRHPLFIPGTNYRVDIFENEQGEIVSLFYSPEAGATDERISNSHYDLSKVLADKHHLNYEKRWCGFYTHVTGNWGCNMLIFYGMSSDYPHNQHAEEVMKKFIETYFTSDYEFKSDTILVIDNDIITTYKKSDFVIDTDDCPF